MSDTDWTADLLCGTDPEVLEFVKALGLEPGKVRRLVLDITVAQAAILYVEQYASRKAIKLLADLPKAPKVVIVDSENEPPPAPRYTP